MFVFQYGVIQLLSYQRTKSMHTHKRKNMYKSLQYTYILIHYQKKIWYSNYSNDFIADNVEHASYWNLKRKNIIMNVLHNHLPRYTMFTFEWRVFILLITLIFKSNPEVLFINRVPRVEQKLFILPEHLSCGVRVVRS